MMQQECASCKRTWQIAEMVETSLMAGLYPVDSQATFCPYCGYSEQAPTLQAENERLRGALEYISSGNPAKPGHWLTDVEMAEAARAALAKKEQ